MKQVKNNKATMFFCLLLLPGMILAQDSTKKELLLNGAYYMTPSGLTYLMVNTKAKVEKRFVPVKGITVEVFLDKDSGTNLVGKIVTSENGDAKLGIPVSLKSAWDLSSSHSFIAVAAAQQGFDAVRTEFSVTRSRMNIDTVSDGQSRSIQVTVQKFVDSEWIPVKDAELKIGIRRIGGALPISEEESYTTDSTGSVIAEFKRDSLPGDAKGNLIVVARIEENDELGNVAAEKSILWGRPTIAGNNFHERSLWATRDRAPVWLLFMAGGIVVAVWSFLVYLFYLIYRLKVAGK